MSKWVISLSGVKGQGPWEHRLTGVGSEPVREAKTLDKAFIWYATDLAGQCLREYRKHGHPHAKVFRLVRRSKAESTSAKRIAHLEWAIRTGGAALRAERAALGVPGGIEPDVSAEERAVVEAAMAAEPAREACRSCGPTIEELARAQACAALRAKRGG